MGRTRQIDKAKALPARIDILVLDLINQLLEARPDTQDGHVDALLHRLGELYAVDRTFLFRVRPDGTQYNSHEWVATGTVALKPEMQVVVPGKYPLWHADFKAGRLVAVASRTELAADLPERVLLDSIGTEASLMVPLMDGARLIGVFGCDSERRSRPWTEEERFLLSSIGRAVAAVLLRAEAAAAEAATRKHLEATLKALPDMVIEIGADGRITACHSDKLPWLSALVQAGIGKLAREVLPAPLGEVIADIAADPGERRTTRTRRVGVSTLVAPHWYEVSVAPLPQGSGARAGLIAVIRDLGTSHTSSEMASYREGQFTAFFEMCPHPILLHDYDTGELLDGNHAFKQVFGLDPQASANLMVREILPEDMAWFIEHAIRSLKASRSYGPVEVQLRRADGTRFPAVLRGFMSIDPNGRRLVWALIEDVTEIRAKEAALLQEQSALTATRTRFLSAIEAMDDGFAIFDADDRLVLWNQPYIRVFAGIADQIREGALYDDLLRTAIDRGVFGAEGERDEIALRRRLHRPLTEVWDGEDELADGRLIWVRERATPSSETVGVYEDVTARRLADRRLQQVMDGSELAVWDWDPDDGVSAMNDRWRTMVGLSSDAVRLEDLASRIHPQDLPAMQEAQRTLFQDRRDDFDLLCRIRHGKGHWVWLLTRGWVLARRADGSPRRVSGVTLDVTGRIEAERRLARLIDGARVGTWEFDQTRGCTIINDRWAEILGYRASDLNPLQIDDWLEMIHPDDRHDMLAREAQHFEAGDWRVEHEMRLRHRKGHWVWVLSRGQVIEWGADGRPVLITGVHIDISGAKALEAALARERDTLARIMETSISGIIAVDGAGEVVFANAAASSVLGRSIEPGDNLTALMCEAAVTDLDGVPIQLADLPFSRALAGAEGLQEVRHSIRWPCGTRRVVSVNAARLSAPGTDLAVVCSFTDITEPVENEDRLRSAMTAAEAANRAKSDFLAAMSHEIRTPLNGVLGMAHVLDRRLTDTDDRMMLQVIRDSGEHLLGVINDILDLAKIEAGRLVLDNQPLNLTEVTAPILALHRLQAEEKGVGLEVTCTGARDNERRLGDGQRLVQILHNLLGNAVKFTDSGQIHLNCDYRSPERLVITVSDTGVGMDEAELTEVMEDFAQGRRGGSARNSGTGLGLAIVRRLVRLMQGELTLTSAPGQGVTARIDLAMPVVMEGLPAPRDGALPQVPPMRVLAAEDNATNRIILYSMLQALGVTVEIVASGDAALERWREGTFDVLLFDIAMPGRDGIGTLAALQAEARALNLPMPPAIAVTANAMTHQVAEYLAQGFAACVPKPISLEELAHALIACHPGVRPE
jgi:PAS domain S-box-containing protein